MIHDYWSAFVELIRTPFLHVTLVWGIVPLYFGLLLNELTADKATFRTAFQSGFSFLWAGTQWLWPYFSRQVDMPQIRPATLPVNLLVTFLTIALGALALVSGIRKRFPRHWRFIGHTRFANYFMITIFPIQAHYLTWTWERLIAIALFALPVWVLLHFGLMPVRNR
ncbi:MAG TPA: hypothetical protein VMA13_08535 [Candidatus Saccharimonadales bacterium]|nr:hypothetical protein [Candidatus Saccharimonadales bacterium]